MDEELDDLYIKYTKRSIYKYGCKVECCKGLWGVIAPTMEEADKEGYRYFIQYWMNGVYEGASHI